MRHRGSPTIRDVQADHEARMAIGVEIRPEIGL